MILDLNIYQSLIYQKLKEIELKGIELNIYDKVPANAKFPFVIIGNYDFQPGDTKDYSCLSINQSFEVWSDYQGKKEINTIITKALASLGELASAELNDDLVIDAVNLMPSTVKEVEGFFNANLLVNFEIY